MTQIERIMANLKCSRAEAEEILAEDKKIDRGEKVDFDLTAEQHKQAMKNANAGTRSTKSGKTARKAPENPTKEGVIRYLAECLRSTDCQNLKIVNPSRLITFTKGDNDYEITLIQKRKSH